jgi:signal transduction histidine kinase
MINARLSSKILPVATAALTLAIFTGDSLTPPECAVCGLYPIAVLLAGRFCRARNLLAFAGACVGLTALAQIIAGGMAFGPRHITSIALFNSAVSSTAIGLATYLVLRGRSAEAAYQRAKADLERLNRITVMGELTAAIGHEVNQPIAAMVTNAGACLRWLSHDVPDLDMARMAASRIVRDGTRAADIIDRIRQVFRNEDSDRQMIDLNTLARETIDLLRNEASRHAISVHEHLAEALPRVAGDRIQLQQVIVNLVANGIDAMRHVRGPRELTVTSSQTPDGSVLLAIADTGVGLPPEQLDQLFKPFFTTKPQGTGMGLAISRSIIEGHHGKLWAVPDARRGAVFQFSLPLAS